MADFDKRKLARIFGPKAADLIQNMHANRIQLDSTAVSSISYDAAESSAKFLFHRLGLPGLSSTFENRHSLRGMLPFNEGIRRLDKDTAKALVAGFDRMVTEVEHIFPYESMPECNTEEERNLRYNMERACHGFHHMAGEFADLGVTVK